MTVEPAVSYLYRDDRPPRFELEFVFGPAEAGRDQIGLRAGSWTVLAQLRDRGEAERIAESLRVRETVDGFPVVDALDPIALSDEPGEGGGPRLTIAVPGDRSLEFALEPGCGLPEPEISESYGAKCLGDLYLGVEGNRAFVEGVLEGLRVEES
jgi:hypothetical protein